MRQTRSSRYRKLRQRRRLYKVMSLLAITTLGASQITPSTYALFNDVQSIDGSISAAFVFPKTIQGMVDSIRQASEQNAALYKTAGELLDKCKMAGSLKKHRVLPSKSRR
ncbi:hypothetical protein [Aneurinibacillus tyrosinisolvens]|uniref:hypothetical protein n=1 Tax=Aneurinibacillus tyrosinisolvens TaxID=1443435 RepID=UPI00063EE3AE|nr:hypothetical protein [Aneurinibacillus tyrosinisolvens]